VLFQIFSFQGGSTLATHLKELACLLSRSIEPSSFGVESLAEQIAARDGFAHQELSALNPFKKTGTERCSRKSRLLLLWLFWH
jgi:hypothetical protein